LYRRRGCVLMSATSAVLSGEVALRGDGSGDGVLRSRERDEERVALGIDLMAAVGGEGLAQDPLMLRENIAVPRPERLEERGRPLDVGEEKGDRPTRELTH
jgi:hypothetical protein